MKILIVGGNSNSTTTGDINVINEIGNKLGKKNEIYHFPYLPLLIKSKVNHNIKILEKNFSLDIGIKCLKFSLSWLFTVIPYLKISSFRGLAYYPITLYNRSLIEKHIEDIRPDVVHIHGVPIDALPIIESCLNHKVPLVVTSHGLYSFDPNIKLWFKKKLEREIYKKLIKDGVIITAVATSVANKIVNHFNIPSNKIFVVLNGVDDIFFKKEKFPKNELKHIHKIPIDKIIILQVSSLNKRKNHIAVLEALKQMNLNFRNKICYLIIGDGFEKENLKKFLTENHLEENVIFKGKVSKDDLVDFYKIADFFILPSSSEGLPLVFLEAMAAGLPIITYKDLDGIFDVYNPYCMELVNNRDVYSLIESIESALNKKWDKIKISELVIPFRWDQVCDNYLEMYNNIIGLNKK